MGYIYIFGTIFFTVYGQLILKWKINQAYIPSEAILTKFLVVFKLLLNPLVLSGFVSAFIASLFWMLAMTRFNISYAYPFMSLSFVLVFLLAILIFHEPITAPKLLGLTLIVLGIIVTSRSMA